MKTFNIEYHHDIITITPMESELNDKYRLDYTDGRWMIIDKRPDDTKTVATFNANISYSTATVWVAENKSEGPDWLNSEQLQVIAEIMLRKEQELGNSDAAAA